MCSFFNLTYTITVNDNIGFWHPAVERMRQLGIRFHTVYEDHPIRRKKDLFSDGINCLNAV